MYNSELSVTASNVVLVGEQRRVDTASCALLLMGLLMSICIMERCWCIAKLVCLLC